MSREIISVEQLLVTGNRGPCGGVNMALEAAYQVLDIVDGKEVVYSNWDLVNNRPIMQELNQRGFISVRNNWSLVPDGSIVFFSAHGVPPEFHRIAQDRKYLVVDVTCQLVTRVHHLALNSEAEGKHIVYIGAQGHSETEGVLGELQPDNRSLVQTVEDVEKLELLPDKPGVVYSQTTLSTSEIRNIIGRLREKYQNIQIPPRWDICYATDYRQLAIEALIPRIDALLVVGSPESHNSQELRKKGEKAGLSSFSVDYPDEIKPEWFNNAKRVGITSGASVLDRFLIPAIKWFEDRNPNIKVQFEPQVIEEKEMTFKLPQRDIDALKARYAA